MKCKSSLLSEKFTRRVATFGLVPLSLACGNSLHDLMLKEPQFKSIGKQIKGVMTRSIVDALSELCSTFLKGGNSAFIAAIASGLCPQTEYRSLE